MIMKTYQHADENARQKPNVHFHVSHLPTQSEVSNPAECTEILTISVFVQKKTQSIQNHSKLKQSGMIPALPCLSL